MPKASPLLSPGVAAALASALLFGAGTPLAKLLLKDIDPWLLAGLLYLGSGIGLGLFRALRGLPRVVLTRSEALWFAAAVLSGGVVGPVLLMLGLAHMPASSASLLLNGEAVFTALLAWFAFHENVNRRVALGMGAILAGAALLSWPEQSGSAPLWPALAVLGACFAWGLDNNLTRKVAQADATWIAAIKGLVAGSANLALALSLGARFPAPATVGAAMLLGLAAYGLSLVLFVHALRELGTARTGAYFAVAPFFGALLALALGAPPTLPLLAAGTLMAVGVWLHLTESHAHAHRHEEQDHTHAHRHGADPHHEHEHPYPVEPGTRHSHPHHHGGLEHSHPHFPDTHHRHRH